MKRGWRREGGKERKEGERREGGEEERERGRGRPTSQNSLKYALQHVTASLIPFCVNLHSDV